MGSYCGVSFSYHYLQPTNILLAWSFDTEELHTCARATLLPFFRCLTSYKYRSIKEICTGEKAQNHALNISNIRYSISNHFKSHKKMKIGTISRLTFRLLQNIHDSTVAIQSRNDTKLVQSQME